MFNRKSLKLGLTGAVLFIIMGSFTACADESVTGPTVTAQHDEAGCIIVGGQLVCY